MSRFCCIECFNRVFEDDGCEETCMGLLGDFTCFACGARVKMQYSEGDHGFLRIHYHQPYWMAERARIIKAYEALEP